jgi:mannitol 2-dehydrogenase
MVDYTLPTTPPKVLAHARALELEDTAPVTHENFRQWVIEDTFYDGRPPFQPAGLTITDHVHSNKAMKLQILNGGHQFLANAGEILGVPTITDCMADTQISGFCNKLQRVEIAPQVQAVPGMTAEAYVEQVSARFANPEIHDTTRRVAFDGSSLHAGFLLPTVRDCLHQGLDIEGLAPAEALWARMCSDQREDGGDISRNDPFWQLLMTKAQPLPDILSLGLSVFGKRAAGKHLPPIEPRSSLGKSLGCQTNQVHRRDSTEPFFAQSTASSFA